MKKIKTIFMVAVCFVFSVTASAAESSGNVPDTAVAAHVLDDGGIGTCVASRTTPSLVKSYELDDGQIATWVVYEVDKESTQDEIITPKGYADKEVSTQYDLIYYYNAQALSTYRATIVGVIPVTHSSNRQIASVSFAYRSGLTCATSSAISGYTASLVMQPSGYSGYSFIVTLGSGGGFQISAQQ